MTVARDLASRQALRQSFGMDFVKIVQSLEEFLYEVMTWLVFYPRTLWRTIRHPMRMLGYADKELKDAPDQQFTDLISPPLFLLLTILLSHLFDQSLPKATTSIGKEIVASDTNLLILRATLFSIYPLMFAVMRLHHQKIPLNRETLRRPFYAQCYIAGPAALVLGLAAILVRASDPALIMGGFVLALLSIGWYWRIEMIWLRRQTHKSAGAALGLTIMTWLLASAINSLASFLILGA